MATERHEPRTLQDMRSEVSFAQHNLNLAKRELVDSPWFTFLKRMQLVWTLHRLKTSGILADCTNTTTIISQAIDRAEEKLNKSCRVTNHPNISPLDISTPNLYTQD